MFVPWSQRLPAHQPDNINIVENDYTNVWAIPQCTMCNIEPHNDRVIYSYFEKGCRKKRTRQPRKVLWVVLSSLLFKEIWENGKRGHGHMSVSAKGKQQKLVRQLQCQEQCIEHIPYYLSGLSRAHFSDNLSRNSCMCQSQIKQG